MPLRSQLQRMVGRDPAEAERSGSSLEVFYDLVFVVAFSVASAQLAHFVADGHYFTAIIAYTLTTFAAIWAWINFAWFASAFDTDDWLFRLLVLIQMVGVAIIAIGIPPAFASIDAGEHPATTVLVIGYMVMRVGMVTQWVRAGIESPTYRRTCFTYAGVTLVAQVGWVLVALVPLNLRDTLIAAAVCVAIEWAGPLYAETRVLSTPWNSSHIAERYSTLTVITLGEGVVGTVALLQAMVGRNGWSVHTIVLGLAAMGVTFAMWWLYFLMPNGETLWKRRERSFVFGYGSIPVLMACAAVGAGLHVVALWIEQEVRISNVAVVASLAVPVGVFSLGVVAMNSYLMRGDAPIRWRWPVAAAALPLVAGLILAAAGAPVLVCAVVICLTPVLPVIVVEAVSD
ncbi:MULTISPECIES: low temperature requirement protein A [Gordonia]|nr:low temperature requirement protein A [Gordonia sp. UBA5067]